MQQLAHDAVDREPHLVALLVPQAGQAALQQLDLVGRDFPEGALELGDGPPGRVGALLRGHAQGGRVDEGAALDEVLAAVT